MSNALSLQINERTGDYTVTYVVPFRGGNLINIKEDGSFTTQALIRHRGQSSITVCKER